MSQRYQAAILSASFNGLKAPDAPTIGTATAGAGSASVAFTAPTNVGGGAITGYTVISSPGSILGTGSSSPITVSGLTNGTAYTFTVVATNAYGTGPASAASNSVTPAVNYIENVFSTYLYTGTGASQTITNGIDLSGKGGLVWLKLRSSSASHFLVDTVRGGGNYVVANSTAASAYNAVVVPTFSSSGFDTGGGNDISAQTYVSWTFRKQEKFFDIVTYTGDGTTGRTVAHNLGSRPGFIAIKRTDSTGNWFCVARYDDDSAYTSNQSASQDFGFNNADSGDLGGWATIANTTTINLNIGALAASSTTTTNINGATYVAYLWAHNAGGFGLSGSDNVISCGSYTGNGSTTGPVVTLGYEPQWLLVKRASTAGNDWIMFDNMRGMPVGAVDSFLRTNTTQAEDSLTDYVSPTATGFNVVSASSNVNTSDNTYIYVAIRRGLMAVPTVGTSVFNPVYGQSGAPAFRSANFNAGIDTAFYFYPAGYNDGTNAYPNLQNRLIGLNQLQTPNTRTELSLNYNKWDYMNGVTNLTSLDTSFGSWMFKRASGFHDVVCYTGTGATPQNITHNLGVAPELIIVKVRNEVDWSWIVYSGNAGQYLLLDTVDPVTSNANVWNNTAPTSSVFSVGNAGNSNLSGKNLVAYLFATAAGVSKVGSYTGTGALQTIACGFTTGARFILIKRTDSTGDWYVWDSARGITAGNDPYLTLNTYNAEVTGTNYVDSTAAGFQVTAAAPAGLNAVGGIYIFLAIA